MAGVNTEFLFEVTADLERDTVQELSGTPRGLRRILYVRGGSFAGPKLKGRGAAGGRRLAPRPSRWGAGGRCPNHAAYR